jgi:hypothetical protein
MRRCPRRGGHYRACQLTSHFLFCYLFLMCGFFLFQRSYLCFVCTGTSKEQLKNFKTLRRWLAAPVSSFAPPSRRTFACIASRIPKSTPHFLCS